MRDIQKILFPTDFSETAQNAFRYALLLTNHINASINVAHVVYPEYEGMDIPVMAAQATRQKVEVTQELLKSFVENGMTQVLQQLDHAPDIPVDVEIGGPVASITSVAERDNVDLIIVGTRAKHNFWEKAFGSVTTGLIGGAPCHVLVVPEEAEFSPIKTIAYATDLVEEDTENIVAVTKLMQGFKPEMHVLHIDNGDKDALEMDDLENYFANQHPEMNLTFHQSTDDSVVEGINRFLKNHEVDMLVMYAPSRTVFQQLFHQSQTKKMAYRTEVPLLIFKDND